MTTTFDLPPTLAVWLEAGRHPTELLNEHHWKELASDAVYSYQTVPEFAQYHIDRYRAFATRYAAGLDWDCVPDHAMDEDQAFQMAVRDWWHADLLAIDWLVPRVLALLDPAERAEHIEQIQTELSGLQRILDALLTSAAGE